MKASSSRIGLYFLGIASALTASVALVAALMQPPVADLMNLTLSFAATGLASGGLGYASHRLGWWRRLPRLGHSLALGHLLGAGLTLLNVWISARLMFLNEHDLTLAGLLLLFASGVSVSFGVFLSHSITHSLDRLTEGAERLSRGDFGARVHVEGRDEVARLALAFNEMAERLARANQEARQQESARRDFVAWTSHDLRTPLASLLAMVDALADGVVSAPQDVQRYLHQSQLEIARLNSLIDALFELARLDTGQLELRRELCSLSDLVSDTLEGVTARARAQDVALIGQVDPAVDPVWIAPREIGRVLSNLLENALRHTPSGGRIELGVRLEEGEVWVGVTDTGEGIAPHDLPRVFERFYRGEESRSRRGFASGGAGLGLAIAKGLVEAHGGSIWAQSEAGKGTMVAFRIPRSLAGKNGGEGGAP